MKILEKSYKNTSLMNAVISKIRLYMNKVDKNHIRTEQIRTDQNRTDQNRTDQIRSKYIRAEEKYFYILIV